MARNKNVYMGGLSGKMGNLVAYQVDGETHIRKSPEFKRDRILTPAQLLHQAKFKLAGSVYRNFSELVTQTFEGLSSNRKVRNAVIANMLTQAVEGNLPNLVMNYSEVQVASGSLKKATAPTAITTQPGILSFSWQIRLSKIPMSEAISGCFSLLLSFAQAKERRESLTKRKKRKFNSKRMKNKRSIKQQGDLAPNSLPYTVGKSPTLKNTHV